MENRVKACREGMGWSQGELARRLGVSRQTVNAVETDKYDPSLPLVIDPVLSYSTYLGGDQNDYVSDIATDADGNTYVIGTTASSTLAGRGLGDNGSSGAFLTKFKPDGQVDYAILLGPTPKLDASGYAYSVSAPRIFFIALASIWRIRSADTPNSSASSCSVEPPEPSSSTFSQRASMIRRLRASSASSALAIPSLCSLSR